MEETIVVIMLKNNQTGFLEKELCSFSLPAFGDLLVNIFAQETAGHMCVHLKLSSGHDVEDWQYNAIYDYYDTEVYGDGFVVTEDDDAYNPVWGLAFPCPDNLDDLEDILAHVLKTHHDELETVYEAIKDMKEAYME